MAPTKVVIIGGSFAGLSVATAIDTDASLNLEITVIDTRSFFTYIMGSVRAPVDSDFAKQTIIDYSTAVTKRTKYIAGKVAEVNAKSLRLEDGTTVDFDYLVIASGVKYAAPYRFTSTTRDAYFAEIDEFRSKVNAANKIVLIGGGAANLEFAAEIKTAHPKKSVTVIERSQYVAGAAQNGFSKKLHDNVIKPLTKLGVEVLLGEGADLAPFRKEDGSFESVVVGHRKITVGSKTVEADLTIVAPGGYKPNSEFIRAGSLGESVLDAQGFVKVTGTLQVVGNAHIFALGDVAATNAPKTAAALNNQAPIVAGNLKKAISGAGVEKTYDGAGQTRMMIVALGPTAAAGIYGNFGLPGFIAKMAKSKDLMLSMMAPRFFNKA
ncbi:hypothetical protein BJ742DRAFT_570586 [Cladochytrium replicatum]|nr:hypothetical protein BJ742DRAFT_570586 [Cladochytrium replicatum]